MTEELEMAGVSPADEAAAQAPSGGLWRFFALFAFLGIIAALGYAIVRRLTGSKPTDPTTERIQTLIDEANRLLKELDDKKPA